MDKRPDHTDRPPADEDAPDQGNADQGNADQREPGQSAAAAHEAASETTGALDPVNDPELSLGDLIRQRGIVAGWVIAWPFMLLNVIACAVGVGAQLGDRPWLAPFTLGLYACMAFFAHAYSVAWSVGAHVRQFLALLATLVLLFALAWLHMDDATERWVYEGLTREFRPERPVLYVSVVANALAGLVILLHGLGLGFGDRFFVRSDRRRVSHNVVRSVAERALRRDRTDRNDGQRAG